jgi:hypothetical protein
MRSPRSTFPHRETRRKRVRLAASVEFPLASRTWLTTPEIALETWDNWLDHAVHASDSRVVLVQHTYLGNHPHERQDDWTSECQGVSHDANHWLITQKGSVWRVPLEKDLRDHLQDGVDGVLRRPIPVSGYDHFGDPDAHGGTLYIPLEGKRWIFPLLTVSRVPRIAAFRTSDLHFLWSAPLPNQQQAGWCAIDSQGVLLSSNRLVTPREEKGEGPLFRYQIEGAALKFLGRVVLRDEQGTPVVLNSMQGGTFADDDHLYLSCGYVDDPHPSWGIHLFDLRKQRRIVRSTNGAGSFNYEFHTGDDEEPEGLTYWNLDGRKVPGIEGQLHAILLDNDTWSSDDVYLKHYRVQDL